MDRWKACRMHGLVAMFALLGVVLPAHATPPPRAFARTPTPHIALHTAPSAAAAVHTTAAETVFLPLLSRAPIVGALAFSTAVDGNGAVEPSTVFAFGIKNLFVTTRVTGGSGMAWRTDWAIDGQTAPNVGSTGTFGSADELAIDGICFGPVGPGGQVQCGDPIPRGAYHVEFFLGDQLYQSSTAVIQ